MGTLTNRTDEQSLLLLSQQGEENSIHFNINENIVSSRLREAVDMGSLCECQNVECRQSKYRTPAARKC